MGCIHNAHYECIACSRERRGCSYPNPCSCGSYACKGISISPRATPTRRNSIPGRVTDGCSYNAQIIYEDRPGGFKMPILQADGTPLRIKKYHENKHKIDSVMAYARANPRDCVVQPASA